MKREQYIGLVGHRDYIFPSKELAVQFCAENSRYKDEDWFQKDAYKRSPMGATTTEVLVIEEKEIHQHVPNIKGIWDEYESGEK